MRHGPPNHQFQRFASAPSDQSTLRRRFVVCWVMNRDGTATPEKKKVLRHVWDSNLIETSMERFYNADVAGLVDAIKENIKVSSSSYIVTMGSCYSSVEVDIVY